MGRPAANTKLGNKRVHPVRCRGGNMKYRALRLDTGNFSWGTEGETRGSATFCRCLPTRGIFEARRVFFLEGRARMFRAGSLRHAARAASPRELLRDGSRCCDPYQLFKNITLLV